MNYNEKREGNSFYPLTLFVIASLFSIYLIINFFLSATQLPTQAAETKISRVNLAKATRTPTPTPKISTIPTATPIQPTPTTSTTPSRINPLCLSTHIPYKLTTTDAEILAQLDLAQAAGARWIRFDIFSAGVTPTAATTDFMKLDYLVDQAAARGIGVIPILSQYWSASWMQVSPGVWNSPPTPTGYATFAQAVATHFAGRIRLYELGNEPNSANYWYPAPNAAAYTALVTAAYPVIKAADPNAKVITAGLVNDAVESNTTNYINSMYASGLKGNYDYFGFHPYSWPASPNFTGWPARWSYMQTLRSIMSANNDTKPIIASEVGWPTHTTSSGVTETIQGQYIDEVYQKVTLGDAQYVPIACIYDMIDDGTDTTNPEHNFGIYYNNRTPKPSFTNFKNQRSLYGKNFNEINP